MFSLATMKSGLGRKLGRGELTIKKYSPEILLALGIAGGVTAAVLAARATLKAQEVIEDGKKNLRVIDTATEKAEEDNVDYTLEDRKRDMALVYVQTGVGLAKLYGPAIGLGALSIGAILASHGIMTRRQVSLIAAYNVMAEGYKAYRERVIETLGEETDRNFRHGLREETISVVTEDENGKKKTTKETVLRKDPVTGRSVYARFFDEASVEWMPDPQSNLAYLHAQQNFFNDKLINKGHVFLNEVYDALGIPRTSEGAIVGWLLRDDPETMLAEGRDGYVDFDIYNPTNGPGRDFVNGYNPSILLDFNVDGVIFDKI